MHREGNNAPYPQATGLSYGYTGFSGNVGWSGFSGFSAFSGYSPTGAATTNVQVTFPANAVSFHVMPLTQSINVARFGDSTGNSIYCPSGTYTKIPGNPGDTYLISRGNGSTNVSFYFEVLV